MTEQFTYDRIVELVNTIENPGKLIFEVQRVLDFYYEFGN